MANREEKTVVRMVRLPVNLDEKLRVRLFRNNLNKDDLVVKAIENELKNELKPKINVEADSHIFDGARTILQTINLPPALDERLRAQALVLKKPKNLIVQQAIERELSMDPSYGHDDQRQKSPRRRRATKTSSLSKEL